MSTQHSSRRRLSFLPVILSASAFFLFCEVAAAQVMPPGMPGGRVHYFVYDDFNYGNDYTYDIGKFQSEFSGAYGVHASGVDDETVLGRSTWHVLGSSTGTRKAKFWHGDSEREDYYKMAELFSGNLPQHPSYNLENFIESSSGVGPSSTHGTLRFGFRAGHRANSTTTAHSNLTLNSTFRENSGTWLFKVRYNDNYHAGDYYSSVVNEPRPQLTPWLYVNVAAKNTYQPWQWLNVNSVPYSRLNTWYEVNNESWYIGGKLAITNGITFSPGFVEHTAIGNTYWQNDTRSVNPAFVGGNGINTENSAYVSYCQDIVNPCGNNVGYEYNGNDEITEYLLDDDRYVWIMYQIDQSGNSAVTFMSRRGEEIPGSEHPEYEMVIMETYRNRIMVDMAEMRTILQVGSTIDDEILSRDMWMEYDVFYYASDPSISIWDAITDVNHMRWYNNSLGDGYMRMTNIDDFDDNGFSYGSGCDRNICQDDPISFVLKTRTGSNGTVKYATGAAHGSTVDDSDGKVFIYPSWIGDQVEVKARVKYTLYGYSLSRSRWLFLDEKSESGWSYILDFDSIYNSSDYSQYRIRAEFKFYENDWATLSGPAQVKYLYVQDPSWSPPRTSAVDSDPVPFDLYDLAGRHVASGLTGDVNGIGLASGLYIKRYEGSQAGETVFVSR